LTRFFAGVEKKLLSFGDEGMEKKGKNSTNKGGTLSSYGAREKR